MYQQRPVPEHGKMGVLFMIEKLFGDGIFQIRGFYCLGFSRPTILSYATPRRVEAT
jgi:hypothetical protein